MTRRQELDRLVSTGRIVFDDARTLRPQLSGQTSPWLQDLVIRVAAIGPTLRVSSVVGGTHEPTSLHYAGRAFDLGNEEIAATVVPTIATNTDSWHIDELIFDASMLNGPDGRPLDENLWNYKRGAKFSYSAGVLRPAHRTHVHLSVRFGGAWRIADSDSSTTVELRQTGNGYGGYLRHEEDGEIETCTLTNLSGNEQELRGTVTVEETTVAVTLELLNAWQDLRLTMAAEGETDIRVLHAIDPW